MAPGNKTHLSGFSIMIKKIFRILNHIEEYVLCFMVLQMGLSIFLQVVLRNIFHEGILWGDILLRHLVLWVGFIGASLATREQKHINIDLFGRFLSDRGKNIVRLFTNLFSVFICYLLADAGWTFVQDEKMMGGEIFADIPAWYFQVIIPIGFAFMAFRFLILAVHNVVNNFSAEKGGEK